MADSSVPVGPFLTGVTSVPAHSNLCAHWMVLMIHNLLTMLGVPACHHVSAHTGTLSRPCRCASVPPPVSGGRPATAADTLWRARSQTWFCLS